MKNIDVMKIPKQKLRHQFKGVHAGPSIEVHNHPSTGEYKKYFTEVNKSSP